MKKIRVANIDVEPFLRDGLQGEDTEIALHIVPSGTRRQQAAWGICIRYDGSAVVFAPSGDIDLPPYEKVPREAQNNLKK